MGKVFDTKKHSNIKGKPEYRLIGKYFKSPSQAKEEKLRRQRVLECWMQNKPINEIARELNLSRSTVRRDLAKLKVTIKRRESRLRRELAEKEWLQISGQLQNLTSVEQAQWIADFFKKKSGLQVKRRSTHELAVVVDADAAKRGQKEGTLILKPQFPALVEPYTIYFYLILEGKRLSIGQISVD